MARCYNPSLLHLPFAGNDWNLPERGIRENVTQTSLTPIHRYVLASVPDLARHWRLVRLRHIFREISGIV